MGANSDIMLDVAPGLTVYRVAGVWQYVSRRGLTPQEVVKELREHIARLSMRVGILQEAADAMEKACSTPPQP